MAARGKNGHKFKGMAATENESFRVTKLTVVQISISLQIQQSGFGFEVLAFARLCL